MGIKVANNAFGTLASSITNSATSITLTTGQGARFPTLSAGDYFYATLIDTSNNLEIVKCTARSTDVLTITRAQENTTARAYSAGDRIEIRITAATFEEATAVENGEITEAKLADGAVTAAKLASGAAVANIATGGIATAKLADDAVTQDKFAGHFLAGFSGQGSFNFNNSTPNSIAYVTGPFTNDPSFNDRSGMLLHLSSKDYGTDATSARELQLFGTDTDGGGLYYRPKQGTTGWHGWSALQNAFAYKEGPTSYNNSYINNWNTGGGRGECLDATSSGTGIYIRESGYYFAQGMQRISAANGMTGLAINGDRAALESRSDNFWSHDHSGDGAGEFSQSFCVGYFEAGWLITFGAPSTGMAAYGAQGYNGGLIIWRLS